MKNIYGEEISSYRDIAYKVINNFYKNGIHPISFTRTETGCTTILDGYISEQLYTRGIYTLFKSNTPIYVGSGNIRYRLYRFGKEVLGKSHKQESHAAGKKYRWKFKEDFTNLTMMFYEYDIPKKELEKIEKHVISIMKPIFNEKI
jgi:hypothetical protein